MATRSNIIVHRADGKFSTVYVHFDGYIEGVGKTLFEHYNSQERAEAVVAPGDISSLAERCDKPKGHSYDNRVGGCTVYYGRDRGETGTEVTITDTIEDAFDKGVSSGAEYVYVWRDGLWHVGDADEGPSSLRLLTPALIAGEEDDAPKPNIKAFGGNFVIGTRK